MVMTSETVCTNSKLIFQGQKRRSVEVEFGHQEVTSDAGALLLREVAEKTGLLRDFAACFEDFRNPQLITHTCEELISQRVYALICGYEDLNDHDTLRKDPLFGLLIGKEEELASHSTLGRVELTKENASASERYKKLCCDVTKVDKLLLSTFLKSFKEIPERLIIDFDATDLPLHGEQEGRFYHGYYGHYCYLPLYAFCGDFPLVAKLRTSKIDASAGTIEELQRIIPAIREKLPNVQILIRADSGFAREAIMTWCEQNHVDYLFGLARNNRLEKELQPLLEKAETLFNQQDSIAPVRLFADFSYQTIDSWSTARRVVGKAEYLSKGANPRFVVTSLDINIADAVTLYEQHYCKRGEMENRIKEQMEMFADRVSSSEMRANQIRLLFSTVAYLLMVLFRQSALHGTALARAHVATIRLKLIKIGALISCSVRRYFISLSAGFPYRELFALAHSRLCVP